jgi:hypothetical protein
MAETMPPRKEDSGAFRGRRTHPEARVAPERSVFLNEANQTEPFSPYSENWVPFVWISSVPVTEWVRYTE